MREAAEVEARIINSNPCRVPGAKGKPAPKHDEPESLSAVELRDYLRAVPERYRVPLMVAAVCGMRSGEVRGLRIRDVDPETGRITIQQGVNRIDGEYLFEKPKTKAGTRTVYAPDVLLRAGLAAQVQARTNAANGARDRLLFTAQDGYCCGPPRPHQLGRRRRPTAAPSGRIAPRTGAQRLDCLWGNLWGISGRLRVSETTRDHR